MESVYKSIIEKDLSKEEFESILRNLFNSQEYHIPLKYPSYILSGTTMYLNNNENKVLENVRNASVIIQIFSKLAEPMLDMYSKKQYGMPYANLSPNKKSSFFGLTSSISSAIEDNFIFLNKSSILICLESSLTKCSPAICLFSS